MISIEAVVQTLLYVIIAGVIFGLLWWLISATKLQEPFAQVARVILLVAAVFILIGILLGLAGHPIVRW